MNDFASIGFQVESAEEYKELIDTLLPQATHHPSSIGGEYARYQDPSGSALWIQLSPDGVVVGAHPFYEGSSSFSMTIHRIYEDEEGTPLDGLAYGTIREGCDCPFVFDVPDLWASPIVAKEPPFITLVRVCAFPKDVSVCQSLEEFQSSPCGSLCADGAMIPSGTFRPDGEKIEPPKPWAIIAGLITSVQCKQNEFSGLEFYALSVKTMGGIIDVPLACDAVEESPIVNGYVGGTFLLSGRYLGTID